ncbi:MAG: sulfotransferase domain-containing protein [Planctomycetota bacterium]
MANASQYAMSIGPTFLIIGAAKAGTTSFWHQLRQHPEVFLPDRKEVHFFSFDYNFAQGVDWYHSWFEGSESFAVRGESSTSYSARKIFPDASARISAYDPNLKLIYLVRDPLKRIESAWQQMLRFGPAPGIYLNGLREIPEAMWVDSSFNRAVRLQSDALISSSNYLRELDRYRQGFPDEQIHVVFFEDFIADQQATMHRCFEFLEVDPDLHVPEEDAHLNPYGVYRVLREPLRRFWAVPRRRRISAAIVDRLPRPLCQRFSQMFLRVRLRERPTWDDETRAWALDQLRDDLQVFLERHADGRDLWRLQ